MNGINGKWKDWVIGIAALLFVAAVGANWKANLEVASALSSLKTSVQSLENRMVSVERTMIPRAETLVELRQRVSTLEDKMERIEAMNSFP